MAMLNNQRVVSFNQPHMPQKLSMCFMGENHTPKNAKRTGFDDPWSEKLQHLFTSCQIYPTSIPNQGASQVDGPHRWSSAVQGARKQGGPPGRPGPVVGAQLLVAYRVQWLPSGNFLQFAKWKMAHSQLIYLFPMVIFHSYVSSQRHPQATGHETLFFFWGGGWGRGWDVKVPVNLLTSCMLRELRGCLGYLYIYIYMCIYIYIYI